MAIYCFSGSFSVSFFGIESFSTPSSKQVCSLTSLVLVFMTNEVIIKDLYSMFLELFTTLKDNAETIVFSLEDETKESLCFVE